MVEYIYWVEFVESCVNMMRQTLIKSHTVTCIWGTAKIFMPGSVGEVALQQRIPPRHICWSRPELENDRTLICQHTMRTINMDLVSSLRIRWDSESRAVFPKWKPGGTCGSWKVAMHFSGLNANHVMSMILENRYFAVGMNVAIIGIHVKISGAQTFDIVAI